MANRNSYGSGLDIKILYAFLAIVGLVVPNVYAYFEGSESGNWFLLANPAQTIDTMFGNKISSNVSSHLIIVMIAFFAWSYDQAKQYAIGFLYWIWLSTILFGLGFGLPLFLLARELNKNVSKDNKSAVRARRTEMSEEESSHRSSSGRRRSGRSHREHSSGSSSGRSHRHHSSGGRSRHSSESDWDDREHRGSKQKDDSINREKPPGSEEPKPE